MCSLWKQLLLQIYIYTNLFEDMTPLGWLGRKTSTQTNKLFETLQVFLSWSEDVHVVWGLSSHYFFINFFFIFSTKCFLGPITIRIDTLWAQLLLAFFTDHFETMHTCFTWSLDVRVVLGLNYPPVNFYELFPLFQLSFFQVQLLLE